LLFSASSESLSTSACEYPPAPFCDSPSDQSFRIMPPCAGRVFARRYGREFGRCGIGLGRGGRLETIERIVADSNFLRCVTVSF
jgi:hypothetical protein